MGKYFITDRERLQHIFSASKKIRKYCKGKSKKKFLEDEILQDAVLYQFMIIGEAVTHIHDDVLLRYEYPWHLPRSFRNYIAHDYFGINLELVWNTVGQVLPDFEKLVMRMLKEESSKN